MFSICLGLEKDDGGAGKEEKQFTCQVPVTELTLCSVFCLSESWHQPCEEGTVIIPILQMRRMEKDDRVSKFWLLVEPGGAGSDVTLQNNLLFGYFPFST